MTVVDTYKKQKSDLRWVLQPISSCPANSVGLLQELKYTFIVLNLWNLRVIYYNTNICFWNLTKNLEKKMEI